MFIHFWGTRGSIPSPVSGQQLKTDILGWLETCRSEDFSLSDIIEDLKVTSPSLSKRPILPGHFGGETTSIEVGAGGASSLFVDAGTGLRHVSTKYPERDTYHILLTHVHWDHILGLLFFEPMFLKGKKINFYHLHEDAPKYIKVLFNGVNFPVSWDQLAADVRFHKLKKHEETCIEGLNLTPFCMDHPGGSYAFRFRHGDKNIAVCTDSSFDRHSREELGDDLQYYQNLDLIVFDAQYDKEDFEKKKTYGHCTPEQGIKLAIREKIKNLVLTHHDPTYTHSKILGMMELAQKAAESSQSFVPKVESAYDGMHIEV